MQISDIEEFKQEWLKLEAQNNEALKNNAKTNVLESFDIKKDEDEKQKNFKAIKRESKNETYKDKENTILQKLLENKFDELDELEILFDMKKIDKNDFAKILNFKLDIKI